MGRVNWSIDRSTEGEGVKGKGGGEVTDTTLSSTKASFAPCCIPW